MARIQIVNKGTTEGINDNLTYCIVENNHSSSFPITIQFISEFDNGEIAKDFDINLTLSEFERLTKGLFEVYIKESWKDAK